MRYVYQLVALFELILKGKIKTLHNFRFYICLHADFNILFFLFFICSFSLAYAINCWQNRLNTEGNEFSCVRTPFGLHDCMIGNLKGEKWKTWQPETWSSENKTDFKEDFIHIECGEGVKWCLNIGTLFGNNLRGCGTPEVERLTKLEQRFPNVDGCIDGYTNGEIYWHKNWEDNAYDYMRENHTIPALISMFELEMPRTNSCTILSQDKNSLINNITKHDLDCVKNIHYNQACKCSKDSCNGVSSTQPIALVQAAITYIMIRYSINFSEMFQVT